MRTLLLTLFLLPILAFSQVMTIDTLSVRYDQVSGVLQLWPASFDYTSVQIPTDGVSLAGVQVVWRDLTGTLTGAVRFGESIDKVNFALIAPGGIITTANGFLYLKEEDFAGKWLRIYYTKGGITGGDISFFAIIKKR